jgi:hypothetical protein
MLPRASTITTAFSLSLLLPLASGCGASPPPPAEAAPQETAAAATPPPQPPPPKCESLDEKCEAKPDTHAKVARCDLAITPPAGWTFAKLAEATVAQSGDATLAVTCFDVDPKDAKKEAASRDAAFGDLLKQIAVDNPSKKKLPWKRPDAPKDVGSLKLGLWQIEGMARTAKKGSVLAVAGPADADKTKILLFIGFVRDDDKSDASDQLVKSVESLGPVK